MPFFLPLLVIAGALLADRWKQHVRRHPYDMPCSPLVNDGLLCRPVEREPAMVIDVSVAQDQ